MQLLELVAQTTENASANPGGFSNLSAPIQIALFLGALSFATAALVSVTAFTRIIIVLSFIRRALSTQEIPPNQVMMGLAIFLTMFVMAPTFEKIYQDGVQPYLKLAGQSEETMKEKALENLLAVTSLELKTFMAQHTLEAELELFYSMSDDVELPEPNPDPESPYAYQLESVPLKILVPAFVISELKTAFIMGFCIYIPFLLIDLVVSTILMSLGMMMMSPPVVSTPCKLLLFVLVDGWQLISRALISSFQG